MKIKSAEFLIRKSLIISFIVDYQFLDRYRASDGVSNRSLSLEYSRMRNGLAYAICRKQENASTGLLAERIAVFPPGTSSRENLAFHVDKMGGKANHCRVTTGRIKARNSAERVFVYVTAHFYNQYYSIK